ncbi:MAG: helix-turn-helix domain-containing protein [Methanomicrobiales archaeon]|nr:helix-turn-helix domain-containing protein [Methanomicrobiales archaeon]
MKKNAVVYLRTRKKKEYQRQKGIVENYCKYHFSITRIFHDETEGMTAGEPSDTYREFREFAGEGKVEHLIFFTLREFLKVFPDGFAELRRLTDDGMVVHFAEGDFIGYRDEPDLRRDAIRSFLSFMETMREGAPKKGTGPRGRKPAGKGRIGRPKALTDSQIRSLVSARRSGTTIGRICKDFSVSRSTVSKILRNYPELKGEWKGKPRKARAS